MVTQIWRMVFVKRHSRFDFVVAEPVRVVYGLSRCLSDF